MLLFFFFVSYVLFYLYFCFYFLCLLLFVGTIRYDHPNTHRRLGVIFKRHHLWRYYSSQKSVRRVNLPSILIYFYLVFSANVPIATTSTTGVAPTSTSTTAGANSTTSSSAMTSGGSITTSSSSTPSPTTTGCFGRTCGGTSSALTLENMY